MNKRLFAIALLFLFAFCIGCRKNENTVREIEYSPTPTPLLDAPMTDDATDRPNVTVYPQFFTYNLHETFYMDDIGYRIDGITLHPLAGETDTGQRLEIHISIYNGGDTVLNMVPTMFFTLTDAADNAIDFKMGSGNTNILMGDIRPGKTLSGVVLYDVPSDSETFLLTVNNPQNNLLFANIDIPLSMAGRPVESGFTGNTESSPANNDGGDGLFTAGVGELITTGIVAFSVDSFSIGHGDKFLKPDEGDCFINLSIIIKNISDTSVNIIPPVMFRLVDSEGHEYPQNMLLEDARSLMVTIESQDEATGTIYYEIPESLGYAELEFKPDMTKEEICVVNIPLR